MKSGNVHSLKEAIDNLLDFYRIRSKVVETDIVNSWELLMGKMIANHTTDIYIKGSKLFLKVDSSVLKNELSLMKTSILQRVNERAGKNIIDEIIIS